MEAVFFQVLAEVGAADGEAGIPNKSQPAGEVMCVQKVEFLGR